MENEQNEVLDEEVEVTPEAELTEETDWKAEALKARGIAKRNATRLERLKKAAETKVETVSSPKIENKKEFDYAEKAYLRAEGIEREFQPLVLEVMQGTGKSLDEVLESKWFKNELKERRDAKASQEAIPSGSKRSTSSARDSVEYWLQKGELPPEPGKLRTEVLNAKIERERSKNQFTDRPLV